MYDTLAYMANPTAWIIILVVVVLLFGANRIPEMFKSLGSGMKEFKKGLNEDDSDKKDEEKKDESVTK